MAVHVAALTEWEKGLQQHTNAARTPGGTAHSSRASTPPAPDARPSRADPAAPSGDGIHHQDNQRAITPDPAAEVGPARQQSLIGPPVAQVYGSGLPDADCTVKAGNTVQLQAKCAPTYDRMFW